MSYRSLRCVVFAALLSAPPIALAVDFAGAGLGAIPDNNPAGINILFNTSSFNQPVGDVKLTLNINHTFIRDLKMTLRSPSGIAQLVIMSQVSRRTTAPNNGSANLLGIYTFSDFGADLWATVVPLGDLDNIPTGNYRTSTGAAGLVGGGTNDHGGCFTSLAGAFAGLSSTNASGVWTLNIADVANADIGTVSAATLSLLPQADGILRNGFEIASRGTCKLARLDFTGTGRTSYVLVHNTDSGMTSTVTWVIKDNDSPAGGVETSFIFGDFHDNVRFFLQGDWDGDGLADAAVWRAGSPSQFIIRPSSHPSLLRTQVFGQTGDDPSIVDDFDGDGLTDFAVYRAGASTGLPSHTLIKLNASGVDRDYITGASGAYPNSGDYNGDGAADIGIQEDAGGGVANYRLFDGLNGVLFNMFTHGLVSDGVDDGNFSGNYVDDITTYHFGSGMLQWSTRDSGTGIEQPPVTFVVVSSIADLPLNGDYDGDGIDDYSYWEQTGTAKFSIRPSSAPATTIEVPMGAVGYWPIGNVRIH
ncbi:MAG: hypothetical protein ABI451_10545 [Dokdonella sp.]